MILLTNGCSWTWGGGLESFYKNDDMRLKLCWPWHLGMMLGADEIVNLAMGCGSNQRIWRTTIDWMIHHQPEDNQDIIAVIQLTEPSRYEHYMEESNRSWEIRDIQWARCKTDSVQLPGTHRHFRKQIEAYNDTRMGLYTEIEGMYDVLSVCAALHSLFKMHKIKYYIWDFSINIARFPKKYQDFILENFSYIPNGPSWNYERLSNDPHPSILGHQQIAHKILQSIETFGEE